MDSTAQRKLLLEEYRGFLEILDKKGIAFDPPFSDQDLVTIPLADLKRTVNIVRDLSRTPTD